MMTTMNMYTDYESYKAMMEAIDKTWNKIVAYFKENREQICFAIASVSGTYNPAYAR